jgi:hypothetical protein
MAKKDLDGFERVPLGDKAAGKRSSAAVTAVSSTKTCGSIQARDVALKAVDGSIFYDDGRVDATLHA